MYSYAIVCFQLEKLRTGISGTRQGISEVLGMMTTVGFMRPSLTTTSLTWRTHTGRTFSETAKFVSDLQDANKK
jgi:hypothetical protein